MILILVMYQIVSIPLIKGYSWLDKKCSQKQGDLYTVCKNLLLETPID